MSEQPTQPGAYVHGPGVFVPDEVAEYLHRRLPLDQLRVAARGEDLAVDAVLVALRVAALRAAGSAAGSADGSDCGTNSTSQTPSAPASPRRVVASGTAARQLGLTDRAVRKAATNGRLPGHREAGRWWFEEDDLQQFARHRRQ